MDQPDETELKRQMKSFEEILEDEQKTDHNLCAISFGKGYRAGVASCIPMSIRATEFKKVYKQMSDFDYWLKNGESYCCSCEELKEVNVEYICEDCFLPYDAQEAKDAQRYDEGKEISKGLCD